ncbi:MAG: class I SAM-dependent methyltransferase [Propylenella sp.]
MLNGLSLRWQTYSASEIDTAISVHDDMFVGGNLAHYLQVGRSAIEMIAEAMLLSRKSAFSTVLDMPCGGGRVTRHLVKFFPDSQISVSDIEKAKQADVVAQFGVEGIDVPADFSMPTPRRYDLIFVGSLLTHLQEPMFIRLLNYCLDGLAKHGVLVATTHGRRTATLRMTWRKEGPDASADSVRTAIETDFLQGRMIFCGTDSPNSRYGGTVYGGSFSPASWVVRQLETRGDAVMLGLKEAAWGGNHDALIVQKC